MLQNSRSICKTTILAAMVASAFTLPLAALAMPGELDPQFGKGGVVDLSEATSQRIPVPGADRIPPASTAGTLLVGQDGKLYAGGGFSGSSYVARLLADGSLDQSFSAGGVLIRTGFLANISATDVISVLPSGRIVTSDKFYHGCATLCPGNSPASGRIVDSFGNAGKVNAEFALGIPVLDGRDTVYSASVFLNGGAVAMNRFSSGGLGVRGTILNVTALGSNGQRDLAFERNAAAAIDCGTNSLDVWRIIARVDPQDRLVIAVGFVNDVNGSGFTSCIFRLSRDGQRDTSFGSEGFVKFSNDATASFLPAAIAFAADGAIRLALTPGSGQFVAGPAKAGQIRLTAAGRPDGRFADGAVITFDTPLSDQIAAIQPLADGGTVIAGYLGFTNLARPAVARMIGKLPDTGFGVAGTGVVPLFDNSAGLYFAPAVLAVSDTDNSVFVLDTKGTRVAKLQGTTAPASPRYDGLWWRSPAGSESGWGVSLSHQGDILFAAWFTYDLDGTAMWLVMPNGARTSDRRFTGPLYRTTGSPFNVLPYSPELFKVSPVGNATFDFSDADNGTFSYTVNGTTQTKPITRQMFGALPKCLSGAPAGVLANYQGLWWNAPANSESGWGISLTHQSDTLFAAWFTYGQDGKAAWLTMANGVRTAAAAPTYSGTLFRTSGAPFNVDPWLSERTVVSSVGTGTFSFPDANTAQFDYVVDGISQRKSLTRQQFASPPTICH